MIYENECTRTLSSDQEWVWMWGEQKLAASHIVMEVQASVELMKEN